MVYHDQDNYAINQSSAQSPLNQGSAPKEPPTKVESASALKNKRMDAEMLNKMKSIELKAFSNATGRFSKMNNEKTYHTLTDSALLACLISANIYKGNLDFEIDTLACAGVRPSGTLPTREINV